MHRRAAAFVRFARRLPSGEAWLLQWNAKWQAFNLIGGKAEPGESFRQCALREAAEELDLRPGIDFEVGAVRMARMTFVARSAVSGEETQYEMECFAGKVIAEVADSIVAAGGSNRWTAVSEIAAGAADGRAISEVTTRFYRALAAPTA